MEESHTWVKQFCLGLAAIGVTLLAACPNEPVIESSGGEVLDFPDAVAVSVTPIPIKVIAEGSSPTPPSAAPLIAGSSGMPAVPPPMPQAPPPQDNLLQGGSAPSALSASRKEEESAVGCGFRTESEPPAPAVSGPPPGSAPQGAAVGPQPLASGQAPVPAIPPVAAQPQIAPPPGGELPPALAALPTPAPAPIPTLIPTDRAHPLPLLPVPPPQMAGGRPGLFIQLDLLPDFMLKQDAIQRGQYVTLSGSLKGEGCRGKKTRLDVLEFRGGRPEIVTVVTVNDIGPFRIYVPTSDHSLWVTAFCDMDGDNFFKEGSDPMGAYARNPVSPTSDRSGLDIELGLARPSKEAGMPPESL